MNIENQQNYIDGLHRGICRVVFEKLDGSERTMNCTLNGSVIEREGGRTTLNEDESKTHVTRETIPVWDTDVKQWRSFRVDSVRSFTTAQLLQG